MKSQVFDARQPLTRPNTGMVPLLLVWLASATLLAISVSGQQLTLTSDWPLDACTDKSFSIPSWIVNDLMVENSPNLSFTSAIVSFSVTNRVTNLSANLSCQVIEDTCRIAGSNGNNSLQVALQISKQTARVSLNQSWVCDDKITLKNETNPLVIFIFHLYLPKLRFDVDQRCQAVICCLRNH
jgi:hypothetical protein